MRPFLFGKKRILGRKFDHVVLTNIIMDLRTIIEKAVSNALGEHGQENLAKGNFDIVDIEGASQLTGYSLNTIYKFTSTNQIPFIKRPGGRKLFFSKKALETWLLGR